MSMENELMKVTDSRFQTYIHILVPKRKVEDYQKVIDDKDYLKNIQRL